MMAESKATAASSGSTAAMRFDEAFDSFLLLIVLGSFFAAPPPVCSTVDSSSANAAAIAPNSRSCRRCHLLGVAFEI